MMPNKLLEATTSYMFDVSENGRPLKMYCKGDPSPRLRLLIVGGQHGDEESVPIAIKRLAVELESADLLKHKIELLLVPELNPDGAARSKRVNTQGIDLNRDHQRLRSREVQALHGLIRLWQPHLLIDVHNYPARRRHLNAMDLEYCHDLFLDLPTTPGIISFGWDGTELIKAFIHQMRQEGFEAERYTLVRPSGRVRHSTPDVVDARNGIALRFGISTLILEGKQPSTRSDWAERKRSIDSLYAALRFLIDWAANNQTLIGLGRTLPQLGDPLPLQSRYQRDESPRQMKFKDQKQKAVRMVTLPGKYTPRLETTTTRPLPYGYAVPKKMQQLIKLMDRHQFEIEQFPAGWIAPFTAYFAVEYEPSRRPHRPPRRLTVRQRINLKRVADYVIFPVSQPGGRALGVYLEPESKYGLIRYPELGLTLSANQPYPVLRVEQSPKPPRKHLKWGDIQKS